MMMIMNNDGRCVYSNWKLDLFFLDETRQGFRMCNVCAMNERDSGAGSFGFPSVPLHVQRRYYFQCSFKSLSPPASFLGRDIFGREPRWSDLFSSMDRHTVQTN